MTERFDVIGFLEEYRKFPCLWKKKCPYFKNRVTRNVAEELLLPLSGLSSINELIRSIRCTYNQEVAKIRKSMGTGAVSNPVYKPKLVWFRLADSFLRQNTDDDEKESQSNLVSTQKVESAFEDEPQKETLFCIPSPQERPSAPNARSERSQQTTKRSVGGKCQRSKKRVKEDHSLDSAVTILNEVESLTASIAANEFRSFGQHLESQLQRLPIQEAVKLQEDIQRLITAARLRTLRAPTSQFLSSISPQKS